jgi:hypothetical protein
MPLIRPGLYYGTYSPGNYGKFSNEVLLVEYRRYALPARVETVVGPSDAEPRSRVWDRIRREVFNGDGGQRDLRGTFAAVQRAVARAGVPSVVFVLGRKVTGDLHVPMRALTWAALVYPNVATRMLEIPNSGADAPGELPHSAAGPCVAARGSGAPGAGGACELRPPGAEDRLSDAGAGTPVVGSAILREWLHRARAGAATYESAHARAPTLSAVVDRGSGRRHRVQRAWFGWGTLAYPAFQDPHWERGSLVQVESDADGDLFGFVWRGRADADAEACILRPLLSRHDDLRWFGETGQRFVDAAGSRGGVLR